MCGKDGARSNADGDVRVTAGREAGATCKRGKDGARSNADGDVRVTAVPPAHGRRPVRGGPGPGGRRYIGLLFSVQSLFFLFVDGAREGFYSSGQRLNARPVPLA